MLILYGIAVTFYERVLRAVGGRVAELPLNLLLNQTTCQYFPRGYYMIDRRMQISKIDISEKIGTK